MTGRPRLSLVAAVAENGVIGFRGDMPWRLATDLKRFKTLTMGHSVIMGRKTFAAIGRALPGRHFIVVTRDPAFSAEGCDIAGSLDAAVEIALQAGRGEIFVIGGGEIYRQAMDRADRLYVTHVAARPEGDTFFPAIDPAAWRLVESQDIPAGEKDTAATRFAVYDRAK